MGFVTHEKDGVAETNDGVDLWETVPRLLNANHYCVLATANAAGAAVAYAVSKGNLTKVKEYYTGPEITALIDPP